jgi:hypothetical protein
MEEEVLFQTLVTVGSILLPFAVESLPDFTTPVEQTKRKQLCLVPNFGLDKILRAINRDFIVRVARA